MTPDLKELVAWMREALDCGYVTDGSDDVAKLVAAVEKESRDLDAAIGEIEMLRYHVEALSKAVTVLHNVQDAARAKSADLVHALGRPWCGHVYKCHVCTAEGGCDGTP